MQHRITADWGPFPQDWIARVILHLIYSTVLMCECVWKRESSCTVMSSMRNIFASHDQFGQTNLNLSHSNELIRKYTVWPLSLNFLTSNGCCIWCTGKRKGSNCHQKQLVHWRRMTLPFQNCAHVWQLRWLTYVCNDLINFAPTL